MIGIIMSIICFICAAANIPAIIHGHELGIIAGLVCVFFGCMNLVLGLISLR